jgi:LacI family transcriptional regulator
MPVVFVDRPPGEVLADTVLVDNVAGAALAVTHLAAHGHHRIAFLGNAPTIFTAAERLTGFREGCASAGIPFDERLVAMGPHTERTVADTMRNATAVVTGNNRITVLALRALAGANHRPALVGFDDFELADLLDPPVTVVSLDPAELGRAAAELLFARLDGDREPPRRLVLPARLTARGSGETPP